MIFDKYKNIPISRGNPNKGEFFVATKKTHVFYMSSAITQSISSGSETLGLFSASDTFLSSKYLNLIPNTAPFNCSKLAKNLSEAEPVETYCQRLDELVCEISK